MDVIREHLMYKNTPITICMAKLTPQEQYEVIRILLGNNRDVKICTHESVNTYMTQVLKEIPNIKFTQCWVEEISLLESDRQGSDIRSLQ